MTNDLNGFEESKGYVWLLWSIAIFGVAVRLVSYIAAHALRVDEAAVAVSIVERSYLELVKPLEFRQIAPLGFVFAERFFVELMGRTEYALRMFPFIAGTSSIFLFWKLAKDVLCKAAVPIAMLFFVSSSHLIHYSNELKQYSTDLCVGLIILIMAVNAISKKDNWLYLLFFSFIGAVAVWFSHPAIFILAGAGMAIVISLISKKDFKCLLQFAAVFSLWVISFLLTYFLVLSKYEAGKGLQGFWENKHAFMPLVPHSLSDLAWLGKTLERALRNPVGIKLVVPAAMLFLAGYVVLYKRRKHYFFISIFTILFALIASGIKAFPFSERLILYTAPIFIIAVACGVDLLRGRLWPANKVIFVSIVFALMFHPVMSAASSLLRPAKYEEIKPALKMLEGEIQPSDVLYISRGTYKPFNFYKVNYKWPDDMKLVIAERGVNDAATFRSKVNKLKGNDRVWVMFTAHTGQERFKGRGTMLGCLDMLGDRLLSYEKEGIYLYLYDLKP